MPLSLSGGVRHVQVLGDVTLPAGWRLMTGRTRLLVCGDACERTMARQLAWSGPGEHDAAETATAGGTR
jgi:hypothetical protein